MGRQFGDWARLTISLILIGAVSLARLVAVVTYSVARICGLGRLFDWVHGHVTGLQAFALHLGEDAELQPPDARALIEAAGYGCEEHTCTTADGYILGLQRIMPPQHAHNADGDFRPPVLMVHGLMQCSEAHLTTASRCAGSGAAGPAEQAPALPFTLAAAGYDVWMGNVRGTRYSRQHLTLTSRDDAFWSFSLDELARCVECTVGGFVAGNYERSSSPTPMPTELPPRFSQPPRQITLLQLRLAGVHRNRACAHEGSATRVCGIQPGHCHRVCRCVKSGA
jgi:hypothetical protein